MVKKKNETLVKDPHELLLSLVDLGSLDIEEALLACVAEMSDAECKRVLNGLSLPSCCEDSDEEMDEEPAEDMEDDNIDLEDDTEPTDDMIIDSEDIDDEGVEDLDDASEDEIESDEDEDAELEARIRRLERCLHKESMNRNRIRKFSRRKTNR